MVASATRGGRRLIVVVLGYPNAKARTLKTASLLDGIEREPARSGREQLTRIAEAVGSPAPPVIEAGHAMLASLRQRGVVLGTRRET